MAGFMKNAMSYLGMSDVAEGEDDFEDDVDTGETSFDSDHSVTPMPSSSASASTPSAPREQSNRSRGVGVSRITTIHPKTYDDAQMVGRAIRDGIPVVLNLTGVAEAWHTASSTSPPVWCSACAAPSNVSLRACSC